MDEEKYNEQQPVVLPKKSWKDKFTKVTSLSKSLTVILFIVFPIVAFLLGTVFESSRLAYKNSCEACEVELIASNLQNQREKMRAREIDEHPLNIVGKVEDTRAWVGVVPDRDDAAEASMFVVHGEDMRPVALEGKLWRSTTYYECSDTLPTRPFEMYKAIFANGGWDTNVVTGNNLSIQAVMADGPLGSTEGYVKVTGDTVQVVKLGFSKVYFGTCTYEPDNSKSTCPLFEKTCPLNIELEIFVSDRYPLEKVYDKVGVIQ